MSHPSSPPDIVCLSHLRWNFVFQRPQHLLTRLARDRRVLFVEEPIWLEEAEGEPALRPAADPVDVEPSRATPRGQDRLETRASDGVLVAVPHLSAALGREPSDVVSRLRRLLDELIERAASSRYILWYYTPMALPFSAHLRPLATVYDCMDELSAFAGAPPEMAAREAELLTRADLVTVGGQSLFEVKRHHHPNVHLFRSSIDRAHFASARRPSSLAGASATETPPPAEPQDQAGIPHPRVGFSGVIDERMDLGLLEAVARARPRYQFCLLGPVAKIDAAALPRLPNIHWLGLKSYGELPTYLSGWDAAILPFAHNAATRFISPTKTPEYLAAGLPTLSTSIRDVVRPYGELGLVRIADDPAAFAAALDEALAEGDDPGARARLWQTADEFLAHLSWDRTVHDISVLVDQAVATRRGGTPSSSASARRSFAAARSPHGAPAARIEPPAPLSAESGSEG